MITARNCPRDTRQSDKIRRADPHPEKKHKGDSHHLTWRLISVQSRDFQSKFSSLLPGHDDSSLGGAVVSHAPFQANLWAESCPITGNRVAALPAQQTPAGENMLARSGILTHHVVCLLKTQPLSPPRSRNEGHLPSIDPCIHTRTLSSRLIISLQLCASD